LITSIKDEDEFVSSISGAVTRALEVRECTACRLLPSCRWWQQEGKATYTVSSNCDGNLPSI